jgi:hypothetical protein
MDTREFTFPPGGYSDVLAQIDPKQIRRWEQQVELRGGPIPAVLDTSYVRTGLQVQLLRGKPPATLHAADTGLIRLFIERVTLNETWNRLPRFAEQLGVPRLQLQRIFAEEWLPRIRVVTLPDNLRTLDPRAPAVQALDPDDYPTAALAALLAPCILLTHNTKHFAPLGVREWSQGPKAVVATLDIQLGETRVQAVGMVPVAPVYAIAGGTKWAYEKIGPAAILILVGLVVGGIVLYRRQPDERRNAIRAVAGNVGTSLMEEFNAASRAVHEAQDLLSGCVVPAPTERSVPAAVCRLLATADESMSAQEIYETLDDAVRPSIHLLRGWLHRNKATVFQEVRRGSFLLGNRYALTQPLPAS